jgi:uncharacterized protein DUF2188
MQNRAYHVLSHPDGGWAVRREGAGRASRRFESQEDAIRYAKSICREERVDLVVHRSDGTIREKDSYAATPFRLSDRAASKRAS